ncbi:AAA family ATPase [Chengkuizengella axinellae]|uniref:AAA family ATPase n=1 Tax=Chengkuizengella axinellae TaxID=3064388 RepID=A0ABT9IV16_9BACL|nr:AAA family ATPase [Chengkuizengella sp. 2205SS18-9]MDP5273205.1 AAA family ATPase [Chengkuizengella sp. 2205SS18-9]
MKIGKKIAITGRKRSGKDTVASYISHRYGGGTFAFAELMKYYAHELFGEPTEKDHDLYQWFGQAMRERDPNIWIRMCFDNIDRLRPYIPFDHVIITDLRMRNEFNALKDRGYTIIRVNAPEELRIKRMKEAGDMEVGDEKLREILNHDTEKYVDTFAVDCDVYNTGSIDSLRKQIDRIMTGESE